MRTIPVVPAVMLAGLAVAGVVTVSAMNARAAAPRGMGDTYKAMQGMIYGLGSKRAVGFFQRASGKCEITLMIAEAVDPDVAMPPSAARLRLALAPGETADVGSAEGHSIALVCGAGAETLSVTRPAAARS